MCSTNMLQLCCKALKLFIQQILCRKAVISTWWFDARPYLTSSREGSRGEPWTSAVGPCWRRGIAASPLHKRRREGRARAHSPATVARPLRAGAAAIANATAGFEGSVELMEGGLVIRSLNSRAMPRKTSTSALAEETKIHFCIYPSPGRCKTPRCKGWAGGCKRWRMIDGPEL